METLVIARAYAGKPLKAVVISNADRVIYISGVDNFGAVQSGALQPVGFPKEDIFYFDSDSYEKLSRQWLNQKRTDPDVWLRLSRYKA